MGSSVPAIEEEWGAGLFTGRVNGQLQKMLWYSHAACTAPLGQHRPDSKTRGEYGVDPAGKSSKCLLQSASENGAGVIAGPSGHGKANRCQTAVLWTRDPDHRQQVFFGGGPTESRGRPPSIVLASPGRPWATGHGEPVSTRTDPGPCGSGSAQQRPPEDSRVPPGESPTLPASDSSQSAGSIPSSTTGSAAPLSSSRSTPTLGGWSCALRTVLTLAVSHLVLTSDRTERPIPIVIR
jgi:hypothetical protein